MVVSVVVKSVGVKLKVISVCVKSVGVVPSIVTGTILVGWIATGGGGGAPPGIILGTNGVTTIAVISVAVFVLRLADPVPGRRCRSCHL